MNILSLFDGMSCGQIALNRCGIKYQNYYASEINKHAIKVTQDNYPNTIQLGSVTEVRSVYLPKIDLLIGGSPCQGFSFAGKGLNFEDPRSKLFFEYVRLLKQCNPKYFLLENVKMKKEHELVINQHLGCRPMRFNSSWVSAQNRERLYWTNIPVNTIPEKLQITISDILEEDVSDKYNVSSKGLMHLDKIVTRHKENGSGYRTGIIDVNKRSTCIDANYHKGADGKRLLIRQRARGFNKGGEFENKSPVLSSSSWEHNNHLEIDNIIRRFTPIECERLQSVPDNYTSCVADTHRYNMLGNGWTIDIICHIFNHIK